MGSMAPYNICAASREAPQWRNLLTARKRRLHQLPLVPCVCKCVRGDWPSLKGGQSFLPLEGEGISPFVTSHLIEFSSVS